MQIGFGQISPSASSTRDLETRLGVGPIIGSFRLDYEYEIEYEYDFSILVFRLHIITTHTHFIP